jgi:hypothetical protein
MINKIIQVLVAGLLATSLVTQAEANPWRWPWPSKTPVKTVQLSLPSNNGGMISVTVPSKMTSVKRSAGQRGRGQAYQSSTVNLHDDERIAADLERHF